MELKIESKRVADDLHVTFTGDMWISYEGSSQWLNEFREFLEKKAI